MFCTFLSKSFNFNINQMNNNDIYHQQYMRRESEMIPKRDISTRKQTNNAIAKH